MRLLERFITSPVQTRHELRVKLGLLDEVAAEVYAMNFFNSSHPLITSSNPAIRFFVIASKLPMELQMMLCQ